MNRKSRSTVAALFAAALLFAADRASATQISFSAGHEIDLDDEDVVITAEDGSVARISPEGHLEIDGRRVTVAERERQTLARYNRVLHRVVDDAVDVGLEGAGLAVSALGEAMLAIATGNGERAERRVEARAADLKAEARELCHDLRALERTQDTLAYRLPAFRPYAVIDIDDEDDCRMDD